MLQYTHRTKYRLHQHKISAVNNFIALDCNLQNITIENVFHMNKK